MTTDFTKNSDLMIVNKDCMFVFTAKTSIVNKSCLNVLVQIVREVLKTLDKASSKPEEDLKFQACRIPGEGVQCV